MIFKCNYLFLHLTVIFICFRRNKELVESLGKPSSNSKELNFPTKYSQSFSEQFLACLWKQNLSYWRNPEYTAVRFLYIVIISLMFGTICWRFGARRETQQDIFNYMGSIYAAVLFIGITKATAVQHVVSVERFVSYIEKAAGMYLALPFAFAQNDDHDSHSKSQCGCHYCCSFLYAVEPLQWLYDSSQGNKREFCMI